MRHRVSGRRLEWRLKARAFSSIDLNFQTVSLVSVSPGSRKRPQQNAGNEWTGLQRACWLPPGAAPGVRKSRVLPGGDGLWVLCAAPSNVCVPIFCISFRFRFPPPTTDCTRSGNFSDGSSETKWPSPPKRNALPKRAGKPPEGSRRNLRDTGAEKNRQEVRHAQRQKNLRATWRAPVLHAEFPHPFCGSGPADRGVDQGVRFYRSRPVRRGQHHFDLTRKYQAMIAAGKPAKVALTALMRKLIEMANALVKADREWSQNSP